MAKKFNYHLIILCGHIALFATFAIYGIIVTSKAESEYSFSLLQPVLREVKLQPVLLKQNNKADRNSIEMYIDDTGTVSEALWPYIHSSLTDDRTIVCMDVSEQRIALLLSDQKDVIVRIAKWDNQQKKYKKWDSPVLPTSSYLDTYHDGDAVLLKVLSSYTAFESFFLSFECIENDWILTDFSDGYTIIARLGNNEYTINDYYVPEEETAMKIERCISISELSLIELDDLFKEYERLFPHHPSLSGQE